MPPARMGNFKRKANFGDTMTAEDEARLVSCVLNSILLSPVADERVQSRLN